MADELELHFTLDEQPDSAVAGWRADPPQALRDNRFELVDESFNSLIFEARYYDWPAKVLFVTTFGVGLLFKGMMESLYKVTARFDAEGQAQSRVTIVGKANPRTRAALGELATRHGGATGLRVGA